MSELVATSESRYLSWYFRIQYTIHANKALINIYVWCIRIVIPITRFWSIKVNILFQIIIFNRSYIIIFNFLVVIFMIGQKMFKWINIKFSFGFTRFLYKKIKFLFISGIILFIFGIIADFHFVHFHRNDRIIGNMTSTCTYFRRPFGSPIGKNS